MKYHEISRYGGSQKFLSHPITETTWDVDICGSFTLKEGQPPKVPNFENTWNRSKNSAKKIWLVVDLPLWKMMDFVSWDDDIPFPIWWESQSKFHGSKPSTSDY